MAGARILVFRIAELLCGAEVTAVREILPRQEATRVPGAPGAVTGIINVRGQLLPLVDGRRALGQSPAADRGSIVLLEVDGQTVGFTVDEVLDLFAVSADDLSDSGDLPGVDPGVVRAVGRRGGESFVLLDFDALLDPIISV
ncbi:MAG: hypothetical protein GTN62_07480 [Gemmatimonadales bacterium]|nr:hypothetical protein [Gemmatimonadales bacterium]NIN11331.1 hypothetical protein [Gemmatimonadales bacterium]NIN49941.1 hypothetical protein [Gemmatimonadales bacterium]NIP07405.1 hypothetical protein [Gemmatimonadales bacterium]NIR00472.1 hypothetical protein [Gemmatimonadales bacterium]